jgi:hypothetical protein
MQTSICTTLRLNGALIIKNITRLNVIMLITGKILEERLISLSITLFNFARTGKLELSLASMMKDAYYSQHVSSVMDGKSRNTILSTTRLSLAKKRNVVVILNVLIIMEIMIVE